ncbi:GtrA family protein [Desulfurella sp.]|uniref:GtrA family protein n=1 Tax=Desulfurella sp. TaxID=1962857 RepID=UPI0025BFB833|nr:GtrA family protein [Desulfurella sp.]
MIKGLISKYRQFYKFLLSGGIAAFANFGSRFFYSEFVNFGLAVVLAYLTGMLVAFILFRLFVFKKSIQPIKKSILYFIMVNIIALIQVYIISIGLADYIFPYIKFNFYPEAVAHAIGISVPTFVSFIGHKRFSFREENA